MINVTIWNENVHQDRPEITRYYPGGIHAALAQQLGPNQDFNITTATLQDDHQGLSDEVLNNTDVLIWWGHCAHDQVDDALVKRIHERVLMGMGFIALHSAHLAKPFKALMGTACTLKWREANEKERLTIIEPTHPICQGLPEYIELEREEMYGERFDIPAPDDLIMLGWFKGGNVFRSGCCYNRGYGRVFYFQPGHESYPTYLNPHIIKIISNAIRWATPTVKLNALECPNESPLETI